MRRIHQYSNPIRGIEARHGYFFYNQFDSYVGNCLELYGEYCENEIQLFKQIIKPTDTVWEIGANIGSQTVPLSRIVSDGTIYAFEPQIELFKLLCANLAVNASESALPLWLALGELDGEIHLPSVDYHQPRNFGAISLKNTDNLSDLRVDVRTIDSLGRLRPPNFLKIDVEGMELAVLRGGEKTIASARPILYIENNGNEIDGKESSETLIQFLWEIGYKLFWHLTFYFDSNNFFLNSDNVYGRKVSCNMVCVPLESNLVINGNEITDKSFHPFNR